ncbi:hypothetical protein K7E43_000473 [Campylobacter coli]|uniref:Uncharacterized protein n=1 Tax=Campylobacter coli TaxID=195 RepID=A0A644SAQ6_CAMCO|nr:hypothetical protein [Campylobacter coli]EJH1591305.1 hypothetical protein [Campylobacter jejuni]EAH7177122.1 hypothetical protein [Campylobacter coli]EAH7181021.1 hypothetical protein [Campylobacter coli]EAH7501828.1 hypothetical protein [Campylobacter coli]
MLETLKKYVENQGIEDNYPKKKYITKKKKALMEQSNANNQRF